MHWWIIVVILLQTDTEKANLLNEYFGSLGVVDNNVIPICNSALGNDSVLDTIEFNTQNVGLRAAICKLKSNLSSGPDCLPRPTSIV